VWRCAQLAQPKFQNHVSTISEILGEMQTTGLCMNFSVVEESDKGEDLRWDSSSWNMVYRSINIQKALSHHRGNVPHWSLQHSCILTWASQK
jgi:hypothetical protein